MHPSHEFGNGFVLLIQWNMRKWRTMVKGVGGMVVVLLCGGRQDQCGVHSVLVYRVRSCT